MVRLSLKYNIEKKEHEWKVLDEKTPALLTIETNHGSVTIRNHPYTWGPTLFKRYVEKHNGSPYVFCMQKSPYLAFLWISNSQIFNPIYHTWMGLDYCSSHRITEFCQATLDILEHDFINYVAKFVPQINALIATHVQERENVEKEMTAMELVKSNP
jgi:hypothetical protein